MVLNEKGPAAGRLSEGAAGGGRNPISSSLFLRLTVEHLQAESKPKRRSRDVDSAQKSLQSVTGDGTIRMSLTSFSPCV